MRKALILIGLIALAMAIYAYRLYNKPHTDVSSSSADIQVEASALFQAYQDNEQAANETYADKILEVRGRVAGMDASNALEPLLLLQVSDNERAIVCGFDPTITDALQKIEVGSTIAVKGLCKGWNGDAELDLLAEPEVVLSDCTIVDAK